MFFRKLCCGYDLLVKIILFYMYARVRVHICIGALYIKQAGGEIHRPLY